MKNTISLLIISCCLFACNPKTNSTVEEHVTSYSEEELQKKYSTANSSLLVRFSCAINADSLEDLLLVFVPNGEDSVSNLEHPLKRKLVVALGKEHDRYTILAENDNAIYHYGYDENFPDAFVDITCLPGSFTINHYGGFAMRWGLSTTFSYDSSTNDVIFERDEYSTFMASNPDSVVNEEILSKDQTGIRLFKDYTIYERKK